MIKAYAATTQTLEDRESTLTELQDRCQVLEDEKARVSGGGRSPILSNLSDIESKDRELEKTINSQQAMLTELRDVVAKERQERKGSCEQSGCSGPIPCHEVLGIG